MSAWNVVFVHWSWTTLHDALLYSNIEGWQAAPGGAAVTSFPDKDALSCCQAATEGQSGAPYFGLHLRARSCWPGNVEPYADDVIQATVSRFRSMVWNVMMVIVLFERYYNGEAACGPVAVQMTTHPFL